MSSWAAMLPDDTWENIFSFLTANCDRNAVSLVCRHWYHIESRSRRRIVIANCYAVKPTAVVARFTGVRAIYIKGNPPDAGSLFYPIDWGSWAKSWVVAMAKRWPQLEEVRLKRMVVNDDCLKLMAQSFKNLRVLALPSCDGLTNKGLAAVAADCRNLMELDLDTNIEKNYANWLGCFPESFTSLVSLDLTASLDVEIIPVVERLVSRCTNIQTLRLNGTLPLPSLVNLLHNAPQLANLKTHLHSAAYDPKLFSNLELAFAKCKGMKSLHLFSIVEQYLPAIYSLCSGLTSLIVHYCRIRRHDLIQLISRCKNLQRLWVNFCFGNEGLDTVASSCKLLQELRVFRFPCVCQEHYPHLTGHGLVTVSVGCPMLQYVYYFYEEMTNAALVAVARNSPNLTCLRIWKTWAPDYDIEEPLDVGFSAIVESCKNLRRLSLMGPLTDDAFRSIGASANRLEKLSVAFAGQSDVGFHYILSGCKSLRKLEIRHCPFGDNALLFNAAKLNNIQTLWMESCFVSLGACRFLAQVMPLLNVEVIHKMKRRTLLYTQPNDFVVDRLYVYKTLAGRRSSRKPSVWTVNGVVRR